MVVAEEQLGGGAVQADERQDVVDPAVFHDGISSSLADGSFRLVLSANDSNKQINVSAVSGDDVLKEFAMRLVANVRITDTVARWEEWTGLRFLETGTYVVPGAFQPINSNASESFPRPASML